MYLKSDDGVLEGLLKPVVTSGNAYCHLCSKLKGEPQLTDYEELVEVGPQHCRVLVRHHGKEHVHTFDFESREWDERDLQSRMRGMVWFPASQIMGQTPDLKTED